jgi:hypothetical protein
VTSYKQNRYPFLYEGEYDILFVVPELAKERPTEYIPVINSYQHIVRNICIFWGTKDMLEVFEELTFTNRSITRAGFPLEVFDEINSLISIHNDKYPQHAFTMGSGVGFHVHNYKKK